MKICKTCFIFLFFLLFFLFPADIRAENPTADVLNIGIYDNPPKVFMDKQSRPRGIFPGIIRHIAEKEKWQIKFIPVTFKQGLEGLEKGTLDIMQDVAWSKKRALLYGFTQETVMVSWGRVYKAKGIQLDTLIDLNKKRIAVMDGGIYSDGPDGLKSLMHKFELNATFIPVNGYQQVLEYIDKGLADAGVTNRLYGKINRNKYAVDPTPILISPISIRFAFSKQNPVSTELSEVIDTHLEQIKNDDHSIYYDLIDEYIGSPQKKLSRIMKNLLWGLLVLAAFFALLLGASSWQTRKKTKQLRKQETALKESEKKFRTIFENLQDVYFDTTISGIFNTLSPSAESVLGFPVNELLGSPVEKLYHDISDRAPFLDSILENGLVRDYEILCKKKDNSLFWLSLNADLYHGLDSKPAGIKGIMRDITQRKQAQEELKKREERFRQMAALLPCGILEMDKSLTVTYTNQTCLDLFECGKETVRQGLNIRELFIYDDFKKLTDQINTAASLKKALPVEHRMITARKKPIDVLWHVTPIISDQRISGYRASLSDLSELKQLQKRMIRNQKLESTGILAKGIAHDFNNILLGVFGHISVAKKELSSHNQALSLLEKAEQSISDAKNLTEQLLTFANGGDPVLKSVTIDQVISDTARFSLSGSNIKIIMEHPEELWQIRADRGQISQVIANLVMNARQAMPKGGTIRIRMENSALSEKKYAELKLGRYVKITISDEGCGIPEKHIENIFDPYFTTGSKSSGLGLSIVHSIVLKHSGYIYVHSEQDKGTTFVVFLPAAETQQTSSEKKTEPSPASKKRALNILIVDDDQLVIDVTSLMLMKLGHTIQSCKNGNQALESYNKALKTDRPFDLVIIDLTIPGEMAAEKIIENLRIADPGVVAAVASGYVTDPMMINYKKFGFNAFIAKPFTIDKIEQIIDRTIPPK